MRRFTTIKGISDVRRLPRLGKIRLGIRVRNAKGMGKKCEHPADEMCWFCSHAQETPWFVCPDEVRKVYGEKPTELDVMLPVNDTDIVFPQAYEAYGMSRGLKCTGNGHTALRYNEKTKEMEDWDCPCEWLEKGKCAKRGHLSVILPRVSIGGVYQIDTSSWNSIVDINSSMAHIDCLIKRIALVPLKLKRQPTDTFYEGQRSTHYTLRLELEGDVNFANRLMQDSSKLLMSPGALSVQAPTREETYDGETAVPEEGAIDAEFKHTEDEEGAKTPEDELFNELLTLIGNSISAPTWKTAKAEIIKNKAKLSDNHFEQLVQLANKRKAQLQAKQK